MVRASIGSMDFFLHVTTARDMATRSLADDDPVLAGYHLFPGIYQFWRLVFHIGGGSLASLQTAYALVLLANAILVGAIVGRATRSPFAAIFAGLWTGFLLCTLEAWQGFLEPVATLPALLGVLVWGGEPPRGRAGAWRAAALGAGLGLALETTAKAGFLALGAVALLPGLATGPTARERDQDPAPSARPSAPILALVPIAAVLAFLGGIMLEGHGLLPLWRGVDFIRRYRSLGGGFMENVTGLAHEATSLARAFELAGLAGGLFLWQTWRCHKATEPRVALVGFTSFAAFATLFTLTRRAYIHYLMLPVPFLVIAVVVAVAFATESSSRTGRRHPLVRVALTMVAALLLRGATDRPDRFSAWPPLLPADFKIKTWHQDLAGGVIARDLARLRTLVPPESHLLVVPPYRNEVHLLLGTRGDTSTEGYFFEPWDGGQLATVLWERVDAVVVLERGGADLEEQTRIHRTAELLAALPAHGFHRVARLETMSLWRRAP